MIIFRLMPQTSFFYSSYVIDGLTMDSTPARLLGDESAEAPLEIVVDESLDPSPGGYVFDLRKIEKYQKMLKGKSFPLDLPYAQAWARCTLACDLIDTLWLKGHFLFEDIRLSSDVKWNIEKIGQGAALYFACEGVGELASDFDVSIEKRKFEEGDPFMKFTPVGLELSRGVGETLVPDEDSWIIYLPFDTDDYHMGGSALTAALGLTGGVAPKMDDPDYFMDCYEVVREMAEDSVLLSGRTVGRGGLMTALEAMTSSRVGAEVDISDLKRAYASSDIVRILFSEVPGVLIQVSDSDFDYIDAEFLLQDVMYFPLGHPACGKKGVKVSWREGGSINAILDSLVR